MSEYRIISVDDNNGGTDGHVIVVRANPVEYLKVNMGGVERILGANYCSHECDETEYFIFPYSEQTLHSILNQARLGDDNDFWKPNLSEFFDSRVQIQTGEIKSCHKHTSFNKQKSVVQNVDFSEKKLFPEYYLIVAMQQTYDLDYGQVISINAIPFCNIETPMDGQIHFDLKMVEYFYLKSDDNVASQIHNSVSQSNRLWIIHPEDFKKAHTYVYDLSSKETIEADVNIHNSISGEQHRPIVQFDDLPLMSRFNVRDSILSMQNSQSDMMFDDDLPF